MYNNIMGMGRERDIVKTWVYYVENNYMETSLILLVVVEISKRMQRYFGNEQRERHRGRLASTTWRIVIWKRP